MRWLRRRIWEGDAGVESRFEQPEPMATKRHKRRTKSGGRKRGMAAKRRRRRKKEVAGAGWVADSENGE